MSDDVQTAYDGSDAEATRALYLRLIEYGSIGDVAINLLRASKASARAKVYRGKAGHGQPSYRRQAYDKKSWSIAQLCTALDAHAEVLGIRWGWGEDRTTDGFSDVLYIDLPGAGQVSFHQPYRGTGPNYPSAWDGARGEGARRIIRFATAVLDTGEPPKEEVGNGRENNGAEGTAGPAIEVRPIRPEGEPEKQETFGF